MRWRGLVERREHLAGNDQAAVQYDFARYPHSLELSFPRHLHFGLHSGNSLSDLDLAKTNAGDLAVFSCGDAHRYWLFHGDVSLRAHHDHIESGRVRPNSYPSKRQGTSLASRSCLITTPIECASLH